MSALSFGSLDLAFYRIFFENMFVLYGLEEGCWSICVNLFDFLRSSLDSIVF